jgi:DNA helicase-2/ATP-dependent DNA helicase PcrA
VNATLHLNNAQRRAVEHGTGAVLVIAGAGSGKTRVLTARVARLIESGVSPEEILAFTFTNRAAREMRSRIEREVGAAAARVWIGTFHATGVRILRRTASRAQGSTGIPPGFTIYDRDDQESLVREILKTLAVPEGCGADADLRLEERARHPRGCAARRDRPSGPALRGVLRRVSARSA